MSLNLAIMRKKSLNCRI